jgi:hypothetical protein
MNRRTLIQPVALTLLLHLPALVAAAPHDWAEGTVGRDDGATRDYYNRAALLAWSHPMGDWSDARGGPRGDEPYAVATVPRDAAGRPSPR